MHCGQSSSTGLAVPGKASQAPFEGNLKQDPDAVERGWDMKGVSRVPARAQAPVSAEAPPLGEGTPGHEAGALLGQAEVALAAV